MRILAAVFNQIENDGRAHRACEALVVVGEVRLISLKGERIPRGISYEVREVEAYTGPGSRFLQHLFFWVAFIREAFRFAPDIIYIHDHYLTLAGWMASRLTGSRVVYDAHELAIPNGNDVVAWQDRVKYWFDKIGVRIADLIVATNLERASIMKEHYSLSAIPLVVRNVAEPASNDASAPSIVLRDTNEEFIFVYEGHLNLQRGVQKYIEALQLLPKENKLIVIGDGPHADELKSIASNVNVADRTRFVGKVPRDQLHHLLKQCDAGLLSYSWDGLNNIYCSPNKIFEYAQAGIPVVATSQPTLRSLISSHRIGVLVDRNASIEYVASAMEEVRAKRKELSGNLEFFLNAYRWDAEAERLRRAVLVLAQE